MKLRLSLIIALLGLLLAACNFTLAADVTPPPGYVPPTPMPTLGPLYPSQAPDVQNGAAIYLAHCAACHGNTGMGDGPQGIQLQGVTVPAVALPEISHPFSPAQWFTTVSQGNLERFMPPFSSVLSEQERWDVVSYLFTLHTNADNVQQGKTLFETKCLSCHQPDFFTQEKMAGKSDENIAITIVKGQGQMPAVPLAQDDAYKVADYLRTLTFALPSPTPTPASVTETPVAAESGTASVNATPLEGTAQAQVPTGATAVPGTGIVRGSLDNQSGTSLPADLKVTLRGYDHAADQTTGPKEVLTLTGTVAADGTFTFENVQMPENRIFLSEVTIDGMTLQSAFAVVKAGATEVDLAAIKVYAMTTDTSALQLKDITMFFDFANETQVQMFAVYTLSNTSDKAIAVKLSASQEIPFAKFPANATGTGYQQTQDSAPFISTADGLALPPSDKTYGLIAFANFSKEKEIKFSQPIGLATSVRVLVPEGVKATSDQLTDTGVQAIQNVNYQTYSSADLAAGDTLSFTLSGTPKGTSTSSLSNQQMILFGAGALGIVLIVAGVWLYLRDRRQTKEVDEEAEDDGFDSSEDVLDAIIALDDLHRAGKISDEAYQKRRDELKESLKRLS